MSSERKIISARANGAKSHGPKTAEGRKRSSMNAIKHGLYSASVVLSTESPEEFQEMLDAYVEQFQPDGRAEFHLVEEMVAAKWRQRRLWAIETELLDGEMARRSQNPDDDDVENSDIAQLTATYRSLAPYSALPFLNRNEARLERAYSRALKTLLELQRLRKSPAPAPPSRNEQEIDETNPVPQTASQKTTIHKPPTASGFMPPPHSTPQTPHKQTKPTTILVRP